MCNCALYHTSLPRKLYLCTVQAHGESWSVVMPLHPMKGLARSRPGWKLVSSCPACLVPSVRTPHTSAQRASTKIAGYKTSPNPNLTSGPR